MVKPRLLVTGATGALGSELMDQLAASDSFEVVATSRRGDASRGVVAWEMSDVPPSSLTGPWDAVVHTAASTRWTATPEEAYRANVAPVERVLELISAETRLVYVSTAFVQHNPVDPMDLTADRVDEYRNAYEWSKATAERMLWSRQPGLAVVRPPLIMGRRGDGRINRFAGSYSLMSAVTSGLAAAVLGDPSARVELAPVDQVASVIVDRITGLEGQGSLDIIAAGQASLTLEQLLSVMCEELNRFRAQHGVAAVDMPPFIPTERWRRFFLPLASEFLSHRQLQALDVLEAFHCYTAESIVFEPTTVVAAPEGVLRASVAYWARTHQRPALRLPKEWVASPEVRSGSSR